jgi:hypothetical protein
MPRNNCCRTPTLKLADLSALRPPKLQRYGVTPYDYSAPALLSTLHTLSVSESSIVSVGGLLIE